jgi:imidazole glycerol-phosphate synthase subunit HisH
MTIAIIDHGHANIRSVDNMLHHLGERPVIARTPSELRGCDKIILPGIGAFDAVRRRLAETGFDDAVNEFAIGAKKPVLGICVGMQMMTEGSTEGSEPGFGWFSGTCTRFAAPAGETLRVPHMGWDAVERNPASHLFAKLDGEARFYFVHSYRLGETKPVDVAATSDYGGRFVAALERDNIFAVQFHPEKSHRYGMALYQAFIAV